MLSRVTTSRIQIGVRSGLVAAAATAGAVMGFSLRHGGWLDPFTALGRYVLQSFGWVAAPASVAVIAGLAAHAAWMLVWGIVFASVVHRRSLGATALAAVVIGVGAVWAARALLPAAMGAVRFATLPSAQVALCLLLMTAGLVLGRAIAVSARTN